jgi:hypothetical protein
MIAMKTTGNILILFLILFGMEVHSQYPNFRIYASSTQQIEPYIVMHPLNPMILFASAYTISSVGFRSEGIYVSTNGGTSWSGTDINPGEPVNGGHGGDPGPIIDKNGIFILTHQGGAQTGMFSNYSTNQGLNWSANYTIISGSDIDKGFPGTDDAPASPFYGRTYLAWTRYSPPFPIVISYTINSAVSWSGIIQINSSCGGNRSFGPALSVSPSGAVYVAWASASPTSPFTEDFIGFAKSSNGGINWSVNECAIDCNGIRTTQLQPWTIRANSFPAIDVDKTGGPRNGWIYIAVTDKNIAPAGSDPDIVLHRSTDNGNTWSTGVRVNRDPINNGRNQFFPALRVDENGGLNIIYYDNRIVTDSVDVFLSRSDDGGTTWNDYRITEGRFYPMPVSGTGAGNMGDNIGLTSGNGKLYPVWMSRVSGSLQIWSAIIDYTTIGIKQVGTKVPISFNLHQNYPNPFNPSTKIKFGLPNLTLNTVKGLMVTLKIYDILGQEAAILVNEELDPGTYEAEWDAANYPSGVYYYSLTAGAFNETKKMVLLK